MGDISAVVGAIQSISSALIEGGEYLYGAEDRVRALKRDLECMQQHLQAIDADPNRVRKDGQLRIFTQNVRELAFRAEDAIDTYVVDVESKVDKKSLCMKFLCLASHSYPVHVLIKEIKAIQQELEEAEKRFERFGIKIPNTSNQQQHGGHVGSSSSRPMPEKYLHLSDEVVVGIRDDVSQLVERLTNLEDDFKVLAIVGTGGGGKTTLASQIYGDNKVKSCFSHRVFISISQQWSGIDLLQRIANKVMETSVIPSSEDELLRQLHDFMAGKQCLVVLDDIWHKEAWDAIRPILPSTEGCRVVLTTRIEEVPLYADNKCIIHEPQLLTEDQRWELLCKIAIKGRVGIEKNVEFEMLGKEMSKKCRGLPLEVVTLAGILRTKRQVYDWEEIGKACVDNILKGQGGSKYGVVNDMLELSYLDLPPHLKSCFLYLAIIPEDREFYSEDFTRMLIAEGFITNSLLMGSETLEDGAMRSLTELAQRCIIQVTQRDLRGQIVQFRVHDLMREFCIKKANEHCFLTTYPTTACPNKGESNQPRRISIFSGEYWPPENHRLRTFVMDCGWNAELKVPKLETIHNTFKLLRVLSIGWVLNDVLLPSEMGNLIHLTHVQLRAYGSVKLPESIKNLRNLLHFDVSCDNHNAVEVPEELVCNMENLRVLRLHMAMKTPTSPEYGPNSLGLSGPKNMHTLDCYAGKWVTEELPTLSLPLQHFIIETNEIEMEALCQCPSILQDRLCTLHCWGYGRNDAVLDLQKLLHCTKLWNLRLNCRVASNCMASTIQFPPNLVTLILQHSQIGGHINVIEVIGQLSKLKHLSLCEDAFLGAQISCASTAFPQLRELCLRSLNNLEEWRMEQGAMDRLKELDICGCEKLKRLPECLRSLTTLTELNIRNMSEEFWTRLGHKRGEPRGVGEDSYIIQHISSVKFW